VLVIPPVTVGVVELDEGVEVILYVVPLGVVPELSTHEIVKVLVVKLLIDGKVVNVKALLTAVNVTDLEDDV
jgi:hypothetical protein